MEACLTADTHTGAGTRLPRGRPHADDTFGEVPVPAAVMERDGAVGEASDPGERWRRDLDEIAQARGGRRNVLPRSLEEHELAFVVARIVHVCRGGRPGAGGGREAVDAQHDAGGATLDLDRTAHVGSVELVTEPQPLQHPADGRPLVALVRAIDGARDDQLLHGARHRDVVEAQPFGFLLAVSRLLHVLVGGRGHARGRSRVRHLEAEATIGETQNLVRARPFAARIRDDDHLELEALGGVDREQPYGVGALLLRDGVALRRARSILLGDEPDESFEVRATELLVRPCQPCELAEVRVPANAVVPRENSQVVVVLDEDALAEQLERELRGTLDQALVPLQEGANEAHILLGKVRRQRPLDAFENGAPLGGGANQDKRVVRDADERRRENGQQRLVVVAVLQQPQVREQVDDLLLPEVAATRHPDRRQIERPELLLEPLRVRSRRKQQDDLARRGGSSIDKLAHAAGDVTCLGAAPV